MQQGFLLHSIVTGIAVLLTSKVVPGFEVKGFFTAVVAAIVAAVLTALLWWILVFITFPLTVLTLGLFLFVVNAIILKLTAALVPGFELRSWTSAIAGSIVLSLLNLVLHYVLI